MPYHLATPQYRGSHPGAEADAPAPGTNKMGWVMGLEPTVFGTTIRRVNQLRYTHHMKCFAAWQGGTPGGTRTPGPLLRRQLLYPPELQARMERVMGIEPTRPAWKAGILPLNYTRTGAESSANVSYHVRAGLSIPFCGVIDKAGANHFLLGSQTPYAFCSAVNTPITLPTAGPAAAGGADRIPI